MDAGTPLNRVYSDVVKLMNRITREEESSKRDDALAALKQLESDLNRAIQHA